MTDNKEYLNNKFLEKLIKKFKKSQQEKVKFQFLLEDIKISAETRFKNNKEPIHSLQEYTDNYNRASQDYYDSEKELANAFYILSEHLIIYAKDIITDPEDSMQEGVVTCFQRLNKFDPDKGKAFNYLTTCVLNHYRQHWRTYKNYKQFKEKYKDYLCSKYNNVVIKNGKEIHLGEE